MEQNQFTCLQLILIVFFQLPHIALLIIRYLVQTQKDNVILSLTENQYDFLKFSDAVLYGFYAKFSIFGLFFLSWFCCCCCVFKTGFKFHRFLFFLDFMVSVEIVVATCLNKFKGNYGKADLTYVLEIVFLSCVGIMGMVDLVAMKLYSAGLNQELYGKGDGSVDRGRNQGYRPQQNYGTYHRIPQDYDNPPPPYRAPGRIIAHRTQAPRNLQVGGIEHASLVLSDGRGGIMFIRKVRGTALTRVGNGVQGRGVEQTQIAWISAEAIRRNPYNPEIIVLTETEIAQIDFGTESENVRRALRN